MDKQRVLFICTRNSARSQMAEGVLRHLAGDRYEVFSAGTEVTAVRPEAVKVMAEMGIDISQQTSKTLERYLSEPFEWVITVCDRARESCPVFPGAENTTHWGFADPSAAEGTEEQRLAVFRRVATEISGRIRLFVTMADRAAATSRL